MKKLISILLTIVTLLSALVVMPSAGAETSSSEKTTYIPQDLAYSNKYGTVYEDDKGLVAESAKGKKVTLVKVKSSGEPPEFGFYMRGKKVIYYEMVSEELYSVGIDGKNKKKLGTKINEFLGGYGDDVIVDIYKDGIYKIDPKGNKTKILDNDIMKDIYLFGGKLYIRTIATEHIVYDLNTKKTSTVKMRRVVIGQNHMYYMNSEKDLIQVDKNGVKKAVARNVGHICAVNNGATVVYSKPLIIRDKKYKTFYRKTNGLKTVKLGRAKDIRKKAESIVSNSKKFDMRGEGEYDIYDVVIGRKNAYFVVNFWYSESKDHGSIILPVNLNTGKIGDAVKILNDNTDGEIDNIKYENGYIYFDLYVDIESDISSFSWDYIITRIKVS